MFFGTGIAPAKQVPHGSAPPATMPPALGKSQTNGPAPPDPLQELIESEKIAGLQSAEGTTEKATDQNRVLPDSLTPGNAMPPQPAHHHYDYLPVGSGLAKPLAHQTTVPMPQPWESSGDSTTMPNTPSYAYPPGTGMKPMLDYLASADPAAYTDLLSEVKKRDKERKRSRRSPADGSDNDDEEEEERPRRVYFSDSGKTHHHRSSKAGKKWKNRMTHVI